jgi:hypothetical protein
MIPALAVPLLLSTVVIPGSASAKPNGSRTVKCLSLDGTYGGSWSLDLCGPGASTPIIGAGGGGPQGTIATAFPDSPATIDWGRSVDHPSGLVTTITFSVSQQMGHKNRCGATSSEWELSGAAQPTNSAIPGVKGKTKMYVCESAGGVLSDLQTGRFAKLIKL